MSKFPTQNWRSGRQLTTLLEMRSAPGELRVRTPRNWRLMRRERKCDCLKGFEYYDRVNVASRREYDKVKIVARNIAGQINLKVNDVACALATVYSVNDNALVQQSGGI